MRIAKSIAAASVLIAATTAGAQQFNPNPDPDLQRHCTGLAVLRDRHGKVVWFNHEKMKEMAATKVAPKMPALYGNLRIQGAVILNMCVAPDGVPQNVWLINGHPLLVSSAIDAAAQWRFRPLKVNATRIEPREGFRGPFRPLHTFTTGNL